jgi:hypothetical protein
MKCEGRDHFAEACWKKVGKEFEKRPTGKKKKPTRVNQVGEEHSKQEDESDREMGSAKCYTFSVRTVNRVTEGKLMPINVGGVLIHMLKDSEASCNIVPRKECGRFKREKIKCITNKNAKAAPFAYGSTQPLQVVGTFSAKAQVSPKLEVKNAEFIVFEGDGVPLPGEETASALGILKIGIPVNSVTMKEIQQDFEDFFQGVGKL